MKSYIILLILSCSFLLSQESNIFFKTYTNGTYRYTINLPDSTLLREFNAEWALLEKGTYTFSQLCVIPLSLPSGSDINSTDSLALTAIDFCVRNSYADGPDGSSSCKPTNRITFGYTKNHLRFVKFFLSRYDNDYQYNKRSVAIVGPFYAVNICSQKGNYVLVIKDGGYLIPKSNDQILQWDVINSLILNKY